MVLWIPTVNKYVVAEPLAAKIILRLTQGKQLQEIAAQIRNENNISFNESLDLIEQVRLVWEKNVNKSSLKNVVEPGNKKNPGTAVYSKKAYQIDQVKFYVEYETFEAEWYNHPKFVYLEIPLEKEYHHYFRVEDANNFLTLWVNGNHAGCWEKADNHFLSGKFSMQIIQKIYNKEEKQWMGVFHAAGISNGKKCIMFFGDSGSGKSTLSALLMANGFDVLSDDFLPVESETGLVYRFPAAISIKKQAYNLVMSLYPGLRDTGEYENPAFKKIYRFLPPKDVTPAGVACKAIIHVKYDQEIDFQIENIMPEDAFTELVPDSWINSNERNVGRFIKWFEQLEHYRLVYSDNEKMVTTIKRMLNDER